jgi:hypothetical protein
MLSKLLKSWRRLLAVGGMLLTIAAAQATPRSEEDQIKDQASEALFWGDIEALERLHAQYQQAGQRTASGRSKLVLFWQGIDFVLDGPKGANSAYFEQMEAFTLRWAQQRPDSAFVHVLYADALRAHAWWHRGTGFANTVSPQARREFERRIEQALAYLSKHAKTAMRSSSGYAKLLDLGRAADWQRDKLWAVTEAGLALNLDDETLYRSMLNAVLPKWGGDAASVEDVIAGVAKRTSALHGDIFYARMYSWASDWQYESRLFLDSAASWPRMKRGYEQLMERHPTPLNLNGFASMACMAGDKPVAAGLMAKVGGKPILSVWGRNERRNYDACQRWLQER